VDPTRAVVLLSGGLDSSTCLAIALSKGREVHPLTVDYGQRHRKEVAAAKRIAKHFGMKTHKVLTIDLSQIGGSALTDKRVAVPERRTIAEIGGGIPSTYVPARNTILLGLALGYAESVDADEVYIAANAVDYSVDGEARVWVRTAHWTKLMTIRQFCNLPADKYRTLAVDPRTLRLEWRSVTGRLRHRADSKQSFSIRLERGHEITVTEDHSLFTIEPGTGRLATVRGSDLRRGTPLVVAYDLSSATDAWNRDLPELDLRGLPRYCAESLKRWSVVREDGYLTNRLRKTRIPVRFKLTDDFLYIIGLWLAEGGKELYSEGSTLAFSIGGIPGAAATLLSFFEQFRVHVSKSPANEYDYRVQSSVFAALFDFLGLFGTSSGGEKEFPPFFWNLSQRQRRAIIAGLWDGDGSHVFKHTAVLAQKSHELILETYHCLALDGIFPILKDVRNGQRLVAISRAHDFRRFLELYPLRHPSKRAAFDIAARKEGRDQATGLWKVPGLWNHVSAARLPAGTKTAIYNSAGKYDHSFRAQRKAFAPVPSLRSLVEAPLAFLRVLRIESVRRTWMYDLSVEGAENFLANGILAHNSGYPDCRPEFYDAFREVARLGTKRGVEGRPIRIHTPLIRMTKADIVRTGARLGVPFELTWSCYHGRQKACGVCDSCQLRLKGFREAGIKDPIPYEGPPKRKRA